MVQHHKKKTLNPTWNEHFHLLVQEPKTQAVRLQVYDWDGLHLQVTPPLFSPPGGTKMHCGLHLLKTVLCHVCM